MIKSIYAIIALLVFSTTSLLSQEHRFEYSEGERYSFEAKTAMTPNFIIHIATLGGLIDNPEYSKKYSSMLPQQFKKAFIDNAQYLNFHSINPHPMAVLLVSVPILLESQRPQDYLDYFPDLKNAFESSNFTSFWEKYETKVDWTDKYLSLAKNFLNSKFNEADKKKWAKLCFDISMAYAHNAVDYKREFYNDSDKNKVTLAALELEINGGSIIRDWEKIANKRYLGKGFKAYLVNTLEGYDFPVMITYNSAAFQYNKSQQWIEATASHIIGKRIFDYFYEKYNKQIQNNPKDFEICFDALLMYYNTKVLDTENLAYSWHNQDLINKKIELIKEKTLENKDITPEELMEILLKK